MPATRYSERANNFGTAAQTPGARLEPANSVIDVRKRSGIRRYRRQPEVQRRHHHAGTCQLLIDGRILQAIAETPRAAMELDEYGKRPLAARLEQARQQRRIAIAKVLGIFNVDLILETLWCSRSHGFSPLND